MFEQAVRDDNYEDMAKLLLEMQHNVIRNACLVGMTSCFKELTKRHHAYCSDCSKLGDDEDASLVKKAKLTKSYNKDPFSD